MTMPSDVELGARLADLAGALDAPSGAGVATAVGVRLRAEGPGVVAPGRGSVARRRRLVAVAAAALAAALAGAVAGPAVADWFGVRGVELRPAPSVESAPTPTTGTVAPNGVRLDLGTPVASLAAAEAAAGFAPAVPAALGPPDAVWVDRRGAAPFISLVYDDGPLLTEFDATLTVDAVLAKMATPETTVERLRIDDEPALWIEGIHTVAVRSHGGDFVFERLRLSDRVLLVQHGSLTVRIEVAPGMGRDDAVAIAESLPR